MSIRILLFTLSLLTFKIIDAQSSILKPSYLNCEIDSVIKHKIFNALDILFSQLKRRKLERALIHTKNAELSKSVIEGFAGMENKDSLPDFYKQQLLNLYSISANEYMITLAFMSAKSEGAPVLKSCINLVATSIENRIVFSIPLYYLTKTWKTKVIGNTTYYYRDTLNAQRAKKFDSKNTSIAAKLGVMPGKFDFYMCDNYQEILQLLGYYYDLKSNGKTEDGYGVDANTIFSIRNNEDFSHDVFHYYSAIIRANIKSNRTVEEGIAYSWGNAYYTKSNGEMIDQKELVLELKNYLKKNSNASLFAMFTGDQKIFNHLSNKISVKSTIASLLCDEVERNRGMEGVKKLMTCGKGDDNFFQVLNELIAVNQHNFDAQVIKLVDHYK